MRAHKLRLLERRAEVARRVKAGESQRSIALALAVDASQVSRDLKAIRTQVHAAALADVTSVRDAELQKLDVLEQGAAVEFKRTRKAEFLRVAVAVSARRSALLGLDGASKVHVTTTADDGDLTNAEMRVKLCRSILADLRADGATSLAVAIEMAMELSPHIDLELIESAMSDAFSEDVCGPRPRHDDDDDDGAPERVN